MQYSLSTLKKRPMMPVIRSRKVISGITERAGAMPLQLMEIVL